MAYLKGSASRKFIFTVDGSRDCRTYYEIPKPNLDSNAGTSISLETKPIKNFLPASNNFPTTLKI